jgi:hypothetical protein
MASTVSRDTPLSEVVLRKYEKPYELPKRDLVKKMCLSIGLLQPGDSRNVVVDILYIFLSSKTKKAYSISEIQQQVIATRKQFKQPLLGIAESNIRRQVRRLRELYLIEKVKTKYRLTEKASMSEIFSERIENFVLQSIINRIKEYIEEVDKRFSL